jgi:hypothetical protein
VYFSFLVSTVVDQFIRCSPIQAGIGTDATMHDHIKKLLDRYYATKDANTRFCPTTLVSPLLMNIQAYVSNMNKFSKVWRCSFSILSPSIDDHAFDMHPHRHLSSLCPRVLVNSGFDRHLLVANYVVVFFLNRCLIDSFYMRKKPFLLTWVLAMQGEALVMGYDTMGWVLIQKSFE